MDQLKKSSDWLPIILMVIYCAASFLRMAYPIAREFMLGSSILIAVYAAFKQRGRLRISISLFHVLPLMFLFYCYLTALWAKDRSLALQTSRVIGQILVTLYLAYIYFQNATTAQLLWIMMMAGYAVCLVALHDQGLSTYLFAIVTGLRVYDSEYINANVMGMLMASSMVINFYFILYEKRIRWWTVFSVPAFICLFGAGSKKGFLLLAAGFGMLLIMRNFNNKHWIKSALKIVILVGLLAAAVVVVIQMPVFSFIRERFSGVINFLTGEGTVDHSTRERADMIKVGMRVFIKHPIVGVGINNSRFYNINGVSYFHNNYVELLACGGVIGWFLYYFIYVYILWAFWKYRAYRTGELDCCLVILLLHIVLEYAYVSYYNKETWFYFMLGFAEVRRLKTVARNNKAIKRYGNHEAYSEGD